MVVPETDGSDSLDAERLAFTDEHLVDGTEPTSVGFVEAIPETRLGETDEGALRERYCEGQDRPISGPSVS